MRLASLERLVSAGCANAALAAATNAPAATPTLEKMPPLPGTCCQASLSRTCERNFAICSKMLFYYLKFPTSRTMKATTDAWIALEDEEDEEEEGEKGGDDDAMRALFEEEQDEEETEVKSDGEDLDVIFELL